MRMSRVVNTSVRHGRYLALVAVVDSRNRGWTCCVAPLLVSASELVGQAGSVRVIMTVGLEFVKAKPSTKQASKQAEIQEPKPRARGKRYSQIG